MQSNFDAASYVAAVATAAGVDPGQVEVEKIEYQVAISYRFSLPVTSDQARSAIATVTGVELRMVTVKISSDRRLSLGRQLSSTVEATIASESAGGLGDIATKAQDTDALTRAMADAGVVIDNIEANTPKKKIEVVTKITSRTDTAVKAPESNTLSAILSSAFGGFVTARIGNVDTEPAVADDTAEANTLTKSQDSSVLAGVMGGVAAVVLCFCFLTPMLIKRYIRNRARLSQFQREEGKFADEDPAQLFACEENQFKGQELAAPSAFEESKGQQQAAPSAFEESNFEGGEPAAQHVPHDAAAVDLSETTHEVPADSAPVIPSREPTAEAPSTPTVASPPHFQPEAPSDLLPELDVWITSPTLPEDIVLHDVERTNNNCAPCDRNTGWGWASCSAGRACGPAVQEEALEPDAGMSYETHDIA